MGSVYSVVAIRVPEVFRRSLVFFGTGIPGVTGDAKEPKPGFGLLPLLFPFPFPFTARGTWSAPKSFLICSEFEEVGVFLLLIGCIEGEGPREGVCELGEGEDRLDIESAVESCSSSAIGSS